MASSPCGKLPLTANKIYTRAVEVKEIHFGIRWPGFLFSLVLSINTVISISISSFVYNNTKYKHSPKVDVNINCDNTKKLSLD